LLDRVSSIAFAEHFVEHMWMRDVFPAFGRMWVGSDNAVIPFAGAIAPIQLDPEWSEINAFKDDRTSGHGEPAGTDVVLELLELLLKRGEILIQVP
jgi:hypothetical protein